MAHPRKTNDEIVQAMIAAKLLDNTRTDGVSAGAAQRQRTPRIQMLRIVDHCHGPPQTDSQILAKLDLAPPTVIESIEVDRLVGRRLALST